MHPLLRKWFLSLLFVLIIILSEQQDCYSQEDISVDFLTGKYLFAKDRNFVRISPTYTDNIVYLQKEVYSAFIKMYKDALRDGVRLKIISGTRSFYDQRYKWTLKWHSGEFAALADSKQKVTKLLRWWWSMPGTSRHHWGTDIDLTSMKLAYYKTSEGKKMYQWMSRNANKYGFYQPFTANRNSGYQEEKWHWSYVPLSRYYLKEYVTRVTYKDIAGFEGSQFANDVGIIANWVCAVNPECK